MVQRLQGLNHGLSTEDLMQLVNDLDTNRDGEISLEEFKDLLKDTYWVVVQYGHSLIFYERCICECCCFGNVIFIIKAR